MKNTFFVLAVLMFSVTAFGASYLKQSTFSSIDECLMKIASVNSGRPMEIVINKPCKVTGYFKGESGKSWACECNRNGTVKGWYQE